MRLRNFSHCDLRKWRHMMRFSNSRTTRRNKKQSLNMYLALVQPWSYKQNKAVMVHVGEIVVIFKQIFHFYPLFVNFIKP